MTATFLQLTKVHSFYLGQFLCLTVLLKLKLLLTADICLSVMNPVVGEERMSSSHRLKFMLYVLFSALMLIAG